MRTIELKPGESLTLADGTRVTVSAVASGWAVDLASVSWPAILRDLRGARLSLEEMAQAVGCSYAGLKKLEEGGIFDPKFSIGAGLLVLHRKHCTSTTKGDQDA